MRLYQGNYFMKKFKKSENGLQMLSQFQAMCSVKSQTVHVEYTHKAVQTTLTNKATPSDQATPIDQAKTALTERGIQTDPIW